jgi:hypothetical protein
MTVYVRYIIVTEWLVRQQLQTLVKHLSVTALKIRVLTVSLLHLDVDIKLVLHPSLQFLLVVAKRWVQVESCCVWSAHVALDVSQLNVSVCLIRTSSWQTLLSVVDVLRCAVHCLSSTSVLPLLKVFNSFHTCFYDTTHAAYTSTKWWWISTGMTSSTLRS